MSIVTLTMNPAIDKSAVVDRVVPERKLCCREPNFEPGGGGINVGRVLQRLGEKVLALYPAAGPPARLLESLLEKENLTRRVISVRGWTRENLALWMGPVYYRLRQAEVKRAAFAERGFHPQRAADLLSGSFDDRQAYAGASIVAVAMQALENSENTLVKPRLDADAVVAHKYFNPVICRMSPAYLDLF